MQTVIELPPRADPGIASPAQTQRASCRIWRAAVQWALQQIRMAGKRCLASFARDTGPGPACAYTMLVASDIRKDVHGMAL